MFPRGEVIIIGATNRLDAVDPALRRAGRFDRELHFPPPHASARRDILDIYTKHWTPRPSEETLDHVAQVTSGYGGEFFLIIKVLLQVFFLNLVIKKLSWII